MFSGVLKFNGYCVEKLNYIKNDENFNINQEVKLLPEIMFKIILKENNPLKCNIIIGVRLGYDNKNNLPFKVEGIIKGFFELDSTDEIDINEVYKYYLQNGTAILYPYLRSTITNLTGTGNYQAIILPTVNFYKLIENTDINGAILPSELYEDGE